MHGSSIGSDCAGEADQGRLPQKKIDLVNRFNPEWRDLFADL
jgi:hypothetical protein